MKVTLNKFKNNKRRFGVCDYCRAQHIDIQHCIFSPERVKHVIDIPEDVKTTSGRRHHSPIVRLRM